MILNSIEKPKKPPFCCIERLGTFDDDDCTVAANDMLGSGFGTGGGRRTEVSKAAGPVYAAPDAVLVGTPRICWL
jgi:hypothetical protein